MAALRGVEVRLLLQAFVFGSAVCQDVANQFRVELAAATEVTAETVRRAGLSSLLRLTSRDWGLVTPAQVPPK